MMRRVLLMMCVSVALAGAAPALARPPVGPAQRDECLLRSRDCPNETDSYLDRIRKLHIELSKGTAVYTPKELERLQAKLEETNWMLDVLLRP